MRHSETDWIILSTSRTFPDPFSFATPLETRFRDEPFFLPRKRRIYFETMFKERGMAFSPFSRVSYKGEKSCSGTNDSIAGSLAAGNLTLKWRRSVRCSGNRKSRTNATFFWWFVLSWIMRFRIGGWAAEDVSLDAYCFFFSTPVVKQKERSSSSSSSSLKSRSSLSLKSSSSSTRFIFRLLIQFQSDGGISLSLFLFLPSGKLLFSSPFASDASVARGFLAFL